MPNPEKFRLMPWSEADQLAYHIGRVTVSWNDVQFWFYAIFRKMLPDPRAEVIFFAIRTDRAQRDMVRELAEYLLADEVKLLVELKAKIEAANQLAGRRNDVLHAIWNLDPDADRPSVLLPRKSRLTGKDVLPEINLLNDNLGKLEASLTDLTSRIGAVLKGKDAKIAHILVAQAFAKGLQQPVPAPKPKAKGPQNGRKGKQQKS